MLKLSLLKRGVASGAVANSLALVLAKGILTGLRTVFLLWMAHMAAIESFGRLALCFSTVEILRVLSDFGTEVLFIGRLARARGLPEQRMHMATMARFRVVTTIAGLAIYATTVVLVFGGRIGIDDILPGALLVTSLGANYAFTYYQAKLLTARAATLMLRILPFYAITAVVLHGHAVAVQLVLLIAYEVAVSVTLISDVRRVVRLGVADFDSSSGAPGLGSVARDSLPIAMSALLVIVYTRLDVFAVKEFAGAAALGLYSYAFRLTEPFRFVAAAIDTTVYSYLSPRIAADAAHRLPRFGLLYMVVAAYAISFSAAAAGLGYEVTTALYPSYRTALPTLFLLSAALLMRCLNGFMSAFQNARGRYVLILRFATINFLLMLALIYPLTKRMGIAGAALTLFCAEAVNALIQTYFLGRATVELRRAQP